MQNLNQIGRKYLDEIQYHYFLQLTKRGKEDFLFENVDRNKGVELAEDLISLILDKFVITDRDFKYTVWKSS